MQPWIHLLLIFEMRNCCHDSAGRPTKVYRCCILPAFHGEPECGMLPYEMAQRYPDVLANKVFLHTGEDVGHYIVLRPA